MLAIAREEYGRMEASRNDRRLEEALARQGQAHLLDGVDALDPDARERFLARLSEVEWTSSANRLSHPRSRRSSRPAS